jgi:SNW domain-containing protein 1
MVDSRWDESDLVVKSKEPPPYGHRKGHVPRSAEVCFRNIFEGIMVFHFQDFGDGGAFPEIHIAQFPLGMGQEIGRRREEGGKTIALQHDKEGKLRFDAIARVGHDNDKVCFLNGVINSPNAFQIVHSRLINTKQKVIDKNDEILQKPTDEETMETILRTKEAVEKLTKIKVDSALPVQHAQKVAPAEYIRYTPSQQSTTGNAQQRIIRMVEVQKDPMEPPRFQ